MEEDLAIAATTGDTPLSVSLELGSAVAGMSGLGPEGSSSWWKEEVGRTPWAQGLPAPARGTPSPRHNQWVFLKQRMPRRRHPVGHHPKERQWVRGLNVCLQCPRPSEELAGVPNVEGGTFTGRPYMKEACSDPNLERWGPLLQGRGVAQREWAGQRRGSEQGAARKILEGQKWPSGCLRTEIYLPEGFELCRRTGGAGTPTYKDQGAVPEPCRRGPVEARTGSRG